MTVDDSTVGQDGPERPQGSEPHVDADDVRADSTQDPAAESPLGEHADAPVVQPMPTQPRRSPAIWAVMASLVVVLVLVVTVSASAGAFALAGVLVTAGIFRAVLPGAVVGLAVRSRTADVLFYLLLAAAMAFLAQTAPDL